MSREHIRLDVEELWEIIDMADGVVESVFQLLEDIKAGEGTFQTEIASMQQSLADLLTKVGSGGGGTPDPRIDTVLTDLAALATKIDDIETKLGVDVPPAPAA